jgi:hypothetical protein
MFNQDLNDRAANKLKEYCRGKRVLLVGNAASLFNHEYGDLIDSYDVVVRFGKGIPTVETKKHLGSKTDVWFFGTLRASMFQSWKDARFKIFNYTQIGLYDPNNSVLQFPSIMTTDKFQIYKHYFIMGDSSLHKRLISEIYPLPKPKSDWKKAPRISQGTLCFLYFDKVIQTQAQLDFVGFDFFESILKFELEGKQKQIYSWHVPIPMNSHEHNPHGADKEKDYILKRVAESQNKMFIHPMNTDIPSEVSANLINKYRPGAIPK